MRSPSFNRAVRAVLQTLSQVLWGCVLYGCASAPLDTETVPAEPRAPDYTHGAHLYQIYCSACHDGGQNDAPTLDDIEAWDERAFQWDAILRQHASSGFLEMPPQGDHSELSEQSMNDVLFFMLTKIRALDE